MDLFEFILLRICWDSWMCIFMFFIRFENFQPLFVQKIFSQSFLFSSGTPMPLCIYFMVSFYFLCSSIRSNSSSVKVVSRDWQQFSHIFRVPFLILVIFLFLPYLQFFPPLRSWIPQSHPWGLESTSSRPVNVNILTSSHESWML